MDQLKEWDHRYNDRSRSEGIMRLKATPATFNRYTNNWRGSYEGWLPGPGALMVTIKKELPGLNNLYMIGQWVEPGGGLPNTIRSARHVAQIICKKDNKEFEVKK